MDIFGPKDDSRLDKGSCDAQQLDDAQDTIQRHQQARKKGKKRKAEDGITASGKRRGMKRMDAEEVLVDGDEMQLMSSLHPSRKIDEQKQTAEKLEQIRKEQVQYAFNLTHSQVLFHEYE